MTFVFKGPMSQSTYFLLQNVSKIRKAESMDSYQGRISDKGHPSLELQQRKPGGWRASTGSKHSPRTVRAGSGAQGFKSWQVSHMFGPPHLQILVHVSHENVGALTHTPTGMSRLAYGMFARGQWNSESI